jgi:soluble lytic murein transglycosylase-like protein
MPQPAYNEGIASVTPDATPPNDYQSIHSDPGSFGGQIAEGEEKLGAGATKAGTFFGQVAADNASNDFQDFATKLLHGDPNKQVPGPDGQMVPDTGYLGLRGRAALDARPQVSQAIDDQLKATRETLTTPEQQLQFDNFSKRYRSMVDERVGTHADGQATTWYQSVNTATAKLALDHISLNANDPQLYSAAEADLVHAYVKNAQLAGAQPGDPQYQEAVASGRRDALKARLDAVAVKDPSQAQAILDKPENKAIAGQYYDNMSSAYRGRAKQQQGYDISDQYIKKSYQNGPAVNPVTLTNAGAEYGISGDYLMHTQLLETGGNPNQTSPTGAKGPFQLIGSTAAKYGVNDPFNYEQSAKGAARFAADNKVELTASLGRAPSDQELYLAHNQGAQGASLLLAHPNQRAGDLVGDRAIRVNGGDPNAPAVAFTSMVTNKYNQATVTATTSRKNQVIGDILAIPPDQIDPDVREHAIRHAEQTFTAQAIAEEQDAKSKKAASDKLQSDFTSRIIKGDTNGIIGDIANSGLPASEMQNLYRFAVGDGGVSDPLQYGPGYTDAMKRILASPDAPDRIDGPREIIQMGADGTLTKRGVQEILSTQDKLKKQPDQAGVSTVKSSQLQYYKSKMAIDDEMSATTGKPYKNQKGLDHFNHDFVPAFESAYSQWVAKGKDPMEFLNDSKQMDAIMDRVYPPAQRAADSVAAGNGVGEKPDMTLPPVPDGLNKNTFETIVKTPPVGVDGKQWTPTAFATAIDRLRSNPTPEMKAGFNRWFGKAGFDADEILRKLPAKATSANPALDKLIKDNTLSPDEISKDRLRQGEEKRAEAERPMVVNNPVQVGVRG